MVRPRTVVAALLIAGIVALAAASADAHRPRGGIWAATVGLFQGLARQVVELTNEVRALAVNVEELDEELVNLGEAACPGGICQTACPCFTAQNLLDNEPLTCVKGTLGTPPFGLLVYAKTLTPTNATSFAGVWTSTATGLATGCEGICPGCPPPFPQIPADFAEARACQRLIEQVVGPCAGALQLTDIPPLPGGLTP